MTAMFPGYTSIKFEDILQGAAGEGEARAAQQWLDAGAPVQQLPEGLAVRDETGFDTRVIDKDLMGKRKRKLSSETVVGSAHKQLRRTAAKGGQAPRPKRKKAGGKPAQPPGPQDNLYSRAAFISHGDGIGALARRRARGPRPPRSGPGDLPAGWRLEIKTLHHGPHAGSKYKVYLHEASGKAFPTLAQAQAFAQSKGLAAPSGVAAAEADQGLPPGWTLAWAQGGDDIECGTPEQEAAFVSPEGLVFQDWAEAESWLEMDIHSCSTPDALLCALRRAAAGDYFAAGGPAGEGPMLRLGLQRARVALFKQERERALRQGAAASAAGGPAVAATPTGPAGTAAGAAGEGPRPSSAGRQRRRGAERAAQAAAAKAAGAAAVAEGGAAAVPPAPAQDQQDQEQQQQQMEAGGVAPPEVLQGAAATALQPGAPAPAQEAQQLPAGQGGLSTAAEVEGTGPDELAGMGGGV